MSTYEQISQQLDVAETTMREAVDRLGNVQTLRPILADLVGRAEAADGYVVVEWTANGLSALELNPRAMRLPSTELADAIKAAIAEATADLRQKTRAALADAGIGAGSAPSIDEVRAQLGQLRERTIDGARQTVSQLDQAMQMRRESGR